MADEKLIEIAKNIDREYERLVVRLAQERSIGKLSAYREQFEHGRLTALARLACEIRIEAER